MKHLGAVRDWIVDLDQDLDVDSNVVLDGDVDVDPFVDLDLPPSAILDEDSATPSQSRCKVDGGVEVYVAVQRQGLASTSTSTSSESVRGPLIDRSSARAVDPGRC